jgi:hypothetical protein
VKESSYYRKLTHYYEQNATCSIAWEAKISKTDRLPFSALAVHQEEALLKAERCLGHKIPDVGVLKKPCDGLVVHNALSVVIVIYYKPRHSEVYEIPIRAWIQERESSAEKSLLRARASIIGKRILI